ncbi:MupG family TIM beta-alpha barrel fold protein [Clostridium boliviensis]|uniref:MupG family TIM beta-alpha barrel fold protein n=1 Tax=Clostridium boliviensis TaxID=318465 RepID=A0ABU4GEQ2_9CLOT|nr:MupG family TIM beta-alpha barrel fold protein [Clostridium boliviensis]MDW2796099.1 MupG family TIM beta-alpha barrel fold protein [Clostridium boliviensis]
MKTGISIYFSNEMEKNEKLIKKAVKNGAAYAFTSLHIPEETGVDYRQGIRQLLNCCREAKLNLIADVGPETYEKLGVANMEELKSLGITHVRLDYGFSPREVVEISKSFHVVFNASTIMEEELLEWKRYGADFTRFAACHNFYPKQFTALSLNQVKEINSRLKYLGFTTMAFVPGNLILRGPLFEGLPTIEAHRNSRDEVAYNMLELFMGGDCDVVLIGDVDIKEQDWEAVNCISRGYVELEADLLPEYEFVRDQIHHDRPDSSEFIFRSQESRLYQMDIEPVENEMRFRKAGSICISNRKYARYMGELEIARVDLPMDERLNVIGQIKEKDLKFLTYIQKGFGVKLILD